MDYIYFDNASSSFPKPPCVVEAVSEFLTNIGASPARSAHKLSIESGRILYEARLALSELLSQPYEERIIFAPNATFALNAVLKGLLKNGDKVVTTSLEHNSVVRPLQHLSDKCGVKVEILNANEYGEIDLIQAKKALINAKVCVCTQVNNVCGVRLPIKELRDLCKESNVIFVLDVSQALGHIPVSADLADILCGSCHKGLYAPSALGFISLHSCFDIESLDSFVQGGSGSFSEEIIHPKMLPDKYEAGTHNMCAISGLYAGIAWLKQKGLDEVFAHNIVLRQRLLLGLQNLSHIELYAMDRREYADRIDTESAPVATLSFNVIGKSPSSVALWLDREFQIFTRVGLHCSPLSHKSFGSFERGGSVRVSMGLFNTAKEVDILLEALKDIRI